MPPLENRWAELLQITILAWRKLLACTSVIDETLGRDSSIADASNLALSQKGLHIYLAHLAFLSVKVIVLLIPVARCVRELTLMPIPSLTLELFNFVALSLNHLLMFCLLPVRYSCWTVYTGLSRINYLFQNIAG